MDVKIDVIKDLVSSLNLNEKYWLVLRNNSEELQKAHQGEGYYTDDGAWIDIYAPAAYTEIMFLIYKDNKLYLGNEQVPNEPGRDNTKKTANMIEYWFRGDNCSYTILHEFVGVHNKSISENERGCGCNQKTLNKIKAEIIESIQTNLNVNDIGKIDADELKDQYGKIISLYKGRTRKLLKNTSVEEFSKTFLQLMNDIETNKSAWANVLFYNNRYWLISEYSEDIEKRNRFLTEYGSVDELYIAVLIIMKEYMLWQLCELMSNKENYYKTVFSKRKFIANPKCSESELYDWKKMWDNTKAIDIILSICYKEVFEGKIVADKRDFKQFRNKLYKQIYS